MKRVVSKVAREIADILDRFEKHPKSFGDDRAIYVQKQTLQGWLLLLAPPQTRTSKILSQSVKERRATTKELDALCREVVFARDGNKCRKCKRTDRQLQWCHVFSRRYGWLRHDLDNSFCGCSHCHMNWWHSRPDEAMAWWEKEIGADAYSRLVLRAGKPRKVTPEMVKLYLKSEAEKEE